MKWNSRSRCTVVCVVFVGLFSIFSFRLVHLQMVMHEIYSDEAAATHGTRYEIPADRGEIFDANGEVLAHSHKVDTVVLNAIWITNREKIVPVLSNALDLPAAEVMEKLSSERPYIVLKRGVAKATSETLRQQLKALHLLHGVTFEPEATRIYPNNSMLCHVIGFTDFGQKGIQGVEGSMEQYLHGQNGFRTTERDAASRELVLYRGAERAPRHGYNVHLTVDLALQSIVEEELDDAIREYHPEKATIILMRPETGEILAMASRPNYDLNDRATTKEECKKNRAISDVMEPGSTFKIVTAAAAINEKKVSSDSMIFCENGLWNYGGRPLHDHHGYGALSVQDILVKSSNIGAAKLALSIGDQKFYEYIRRFGFGEQTGVELPGESPGQLRAPTSWAKIDITRISMGHSVGVTPLQMCTAMAVIANGGKLVTPRIVKSVTSAEGETVSTFKPTVLRQVITPETAQQIGDALRGVVSDRGTARDVVVPGFTIAGKTGTAQKVREGGGGYESGKYVVSFSGYMPAENPAFVALVTLDDAKTKTPEQNYGGTVAAPIFAKIAARAARHLDLVPREEIKKAIPVGQLASANAPGR